MFGWPLSKPRLTSGFVMRPAFKLQDGSILPATFHPGLDFGAPPGEPIMAAESGLVLRAGNFNDGYGNRVILLHDKLDDGGWVTTYNHMRDVPPVKQGDRVTRGQVIGQVGSTGKSTGPHLHFEVRREESEGRVFYDPKELLPGGGGVSAATRWNSTKQALLGAVLKAPPPRTV